MLLALVILPLLRNVLFWAYVWQLKEYRLDRLKDYLSTSQWKKAEFNILSLIDCFSILFFWICYVFYDNVFLLIWTQAIYSAVMWILGIESLFVIFKILRWEFIVPRFTGRLILNLFITLLLQSLIILYFYNSFFLYFIIFCVLAMSKNFFGISILIIHPVNKFFRNRMIKKASLKIRSLNNLLSVWVTWSFWKSSMKELLHSMLSQNFCVVSTLENNNTPLWISKNIINRVNSKHEYFICEMWAYKLWEIKELWEIVNHRFWFLTWINNQHIGLFLGQSNIVKAKFEILEKVTENDWILYVNWDNDFILNHIKELKKDEIEFDLKRLPNDFDYKKIGKWKIVTYWIDNINADAYSVVRNFSVKNTEFEFNYRWNRYNFSTCLFWKHQVLNLTWAIAFALDLWITQANIQKWIEWIRCPKHTLNLIKNRNDVLLIDDTYNLNVDWLVSACDSLDVFRWVKKVLVLDDIIELWRDSKNVHLKIWSQLSWFWFDKIFLIWKNYSHYVRKWLIKAWFDKKNIINKDHIWRMQFNSELQNVILPEFVILFEWQWARKYFVNAN